MLCHTTMLKVWYTTYTCICHCPLIKCLHSGKLIHLFVHIARSNYRQNKSPLVFQEMMSQSYAITAATDLSSNSSIFVHCNANMFRSASDTRQCMNDLGTAGPAVFVMFGINVTIVAKYMFDLSSDGQFFNELTNGTFDVVLDTLVVAAERAERGITFSNVLVPANYLFVANADKHQSSGPNLSILTDQFTKQALTIWIFTAITLLLVTLYYIVAKAAHG